MKSDEVHQITSSHQFDVRPDESSLAMMLAQKLAHISLGHSLDANYAFNDRMMFDDTKTLN